MVVGIDKGRDAFVTGLSSYYYAAFKTHQEQRHQSGVSLFRVCVGVLAGSHPLRCPEAVTSKNTNYSDEYHSWLAPWTNHI